MKIGKHFVKSLVVMVAVVWGAENAQALTLGQANIGDFSVNPSLATFSTSFFGKSYSEAGATFFEEDSNIDLFIDGVAENLNTFDTFNSPADTTPILIVEFDSPVNVVGFDWINGAMNLTIDVFVGKDGSGLTDQLNLAAPASTVPNPNFLAFKSTDGMSFQRIRIAMGDTQGSAFIDDFRFNPAAGGTPPTNNAVPEPTTALLGVMGLGAFLAVVTRARIKKTGRPRAFSCLVYGSATSHDCQGAG